MLCSITGRQRYRDNVTIVSLAASQLGDWSDSSAQLRVNAFLEVFEKKQRVDRDRRNQRDREQKIHRHGHVRPKLPNRLFHAQFWSGRRRIVTRFVFARRACAARPFESVASTDSLRNRSNDRPVIAQPYVPE
jgi:hypothetical protein